MESKDEVKQFGREREEVTLLSGTEPGMVNAIVLVAEGLATQGGDAEPGTSRHGHGNGDDGGSHRHAWAARRRRS